MDREDTASLAFRLFPYDNPYPQQRQFMRRMVDTLIDGKVGIFESPTGTVLSMIGLYVTEDCRERL